ncbi:hypothetical protein D1007_19718 [Hordeum vulgare]|nr:hypothetical protein D1007_19718 [Hordeum vulgare]
MVPTDKQEPEGHGPAPASPLLDCALSKDADRVPVLPWTAIESNEHGRNLIWPDTIEERPAPGALYPLVLRSIYARVVPPLSRFFSALLDHNGIQALHLQPNSILLLSVFAFYSKAFVGVQTSVALFRHFFILRLHAYAHLSACVSFVVAQSDNMLLKARKKVQNFRHHWVLMYLKDANPRAKRLTGGMIVKEFLVQRLAPIQVRSSPLWEYWTDEDELRLRSWDLRIEDLRRVLAILLGGDPSNLPEALGPLYRRDDRTDLVAVIRVFNERGLLPAEGFGPVELSCGNTSGEGGSEKTVDDCAVRVPLLSPSVLLHELEDDGLTEDTSTGTPLRPARASRVLVPTPSAMRSACVHASRKLGAEPSPADPASTDGRSKAPSSPPSMRGPVSSIVTGAEKRKR